MLAQIRKGNWIFDTILIVSKINKNPCGISEFPNLALLERYREQLNKVAKHPAPLALAIPTQENG